MSDTPASEPTMPESPTMAEILQGAPPMGDLRQFVIEDLTPDEEDAFFAILEDA
jgi:hypothetical protein